jgi:chromosome segregation ATPase
MYSSARLRNGVLKELDEKFGVIEKRVRALITENKNLIERISSLEQELLAARREAQQSEHHFGRNVRIREKIENILHTLESIGVKKSD